MARILAGNTSASTLFRKLVDTCLWNKLRCRLKWEDKKRGRGREGKKGTNSSATRSKKFETSSNFARFTRSTSIESFNNLEITFEQFSQHGYQKTNCVYCTRFSRKNSWLMHEWDNLIYKKFEHDLNKYRVLRNKFSNILTFGIIPVECELSPEFSSLMR